MDIDNKWMLWQRKNCQYRLLTWNSFIGQFVHSVGGREWGKGGSVSFLYPATSFTLLEYMEI